MLPETMINYQGIIAVLIEFKINSKNNFQKNLLMQKLNLRFASSKKQ